MYIIDKFQRLESQSKNSEIFLKFIKSYMLKHNSVETIRILKLSGIGIQRYSNENKLEELKSLTIELISQYGENDENIKKWQQELSIINDSYSELISLRNEHGVSQIKKKRQGAAFLIALEIYLGSIKEYSNGEKIEEIKKVYPFVVTLIDKDKGVLLPPTADHNQLSQIIDVVAEGAGSILKHIQYEGSSIEFMNSLKYEEIKNVRNHIGLYDTYSLIENLEEQWRILDFDITTNNEVIEFSMSQEESFQAVTLSSNRYQSQRSKLFLDFKNLDKSQLRLKIKSDSSILPPNEFINEEEAMYSINLGELLFTNDLTITLKNVELREWIRAYTVIKREMNNLIENRYAVKKVSPIQLKNWCDVRPVSNWVETFISAGIPINSAKKIIDSLTFTSKSTDLLDCPFIQIQDKKQKENNICVVPTLAAIIDPAASIISNMTKNTTDIAIKGTNFENEVLELLKNAGINAKNIKNQVNGETYECDIFFVIEDNLFLIECKAFAQPSGTRGYYNLMQNILPPMEIIFPRAKNERSATEQLNRITDYYLDNLSLLSKKLGLSDLWKPKSVTRLILTTAKLGENLFCDNCHILDYAIFSRFIEREAPAIIIDKLKIIDTDENYEGAITFEKLMNIIKSSPQINILKSKLDLKIIQKHIYKRNLVFPRYTNNSSTLQLMDHSIIDELIERGILPEVFKDYLIKQKHRS